MAGMSNRRADHNRIWACRHRTTDPELRRTIWRSLLPSSLVISLTATRSAMSPFCATGASKWLARPQYCRSRHLVVEGIETSDPGLIGHPPLGVLDHS